MNQNSNSARLNETVARELLENTRRLLVYIDTGLNHLLAAPREAEAMALETLESTDL